MNNVPLHDDEQLILADEERHSWVTYAPHFLAPAKARALFDELLRSTPFEREAPIMFGRPIEVRRTTCSFGERGIRYRYAGLERVAAPWPEALLPILDELEARTGVRFNYALCQHYPDGEAGIGWHADDERDIARGAPIASLSLGAERDFQMRLGKKGPTTVTVRLAHGSLLVMGGEMQRHYHHQLPKRARCRDARVNLTFRLLHERRA